MALRGADRRTGALRDLHSIVAKSNFKTVPNQGMVKSGEVTIQADSSLLPKIIQFQVSKLGIWEVDVFVFNLIADMVVKIESTPFLTLKLRQKTTGNFGTQLKLIVPGMVTVQLVNNIEKNGMEMTLKAVAPIISASADYRSQLVSGWGKKGKVTFFDEITKIVSNSFGDIIPTILGSNSPPFSQGGGHY